jgi:REP element-mobilizing transposase RayT
MTTLPNRRSVRLPHYDYAASGGYFITICTGDRAPLFDDPRLRTIVETAWNDIPSHHPSVEIDEFVVMPNHVHGVLFLGASDVERTRAQRVAPLQRTGVHLAPGAGASGADRARAQQVAPLQGSRPHLVGGSLGAIVRAFKARVTRDIRAALGSDVTVWQRNYHEHVIRHEAALMRIRQYIVDNPARWEFDYENPVGRADQIEREFRDWLSSMAPHFTSSVGAAR